MLFSMRREHLIDVKNRYHFNRYQEERSIPYEFIRNYPKFNEEYERDECRESHRSLS